MIQAQNLIDSRHLVKGMWPSEQQMWINDVVSVIKDQQKELAALRSRIDTAPVAIMGTRTETEASFEALYALQGHKVALIDLGVVE